MKRTLHRLRLLVVALLVMSTSVAAVCTPVSAQTLRSDVRQPKPASKTCCCGTTDGRCCGMACCMRQTSNQVPSNPPLRASGEKDHSPTLGLPASAMVSGESDGGGFIRPARAEIDGLSAVSTLQSQHVRIQT